MRVLVTRPESKARTTCTQLERLGHHPVAMPLFTTVHMPDVARTALATGNFAALAVTSTEALHGLDATRDAPEMIDRPVFAVGAETARAATAAGFIRVLTGSGNGEALADAIAAEPAFPSHAQLLYLAGELRTPLLERKLTTLGIPFETAVVYGMEPVTYQAADIRAALKGLDAILFYSRMTAARFFALGAEKLMAGLTAPPALACLSSNVANAVPASLAGHVKIAAHPSQQSLLDLLQ